MMTKHGDTIYVGKTKIATIDPAAARAVLLSLGWRPAVIAAVQAGLCYRRASGSVWSGGQER